MAFADILREMVEGVDGGLAAILMGMDGLPVQQHIAKSGYDIETVGVEYGKVVDEIRNATTILNLGTLEDVFIRTAGSDVIIKMVSPEYYIAFVIRHGANMGKAGFLAERAVVKAKEELAA